MKKIVIAIDFTGIAMLLFIINAFSQKTPMVNWTLYNILPPQSGTEHPGLAGPIVGVLQDDLFIGGGANFPDGLPWDGGKKKYHAQGYILDKKNNWKMLNANCFPAPIAYSAFVSFQDQIIYLGGERDTGVVDDIYSISHSGFTKKVSFHWKGRLPKPMTNLSAATWGKFLFIAGGENAEGVSNSFYRAEINDIGMVWKPLSDIPHPVSHAVLLTHPDLPLMYLIGGRSKKKGEISTVYKSVYEFDILNNFWTEKESMPIPLAAAAGEWLDKVNFLLCGGDDGTTFNKVEKLLLDIETEKDESRKKSLIKSKNKLQIEHPGFNQKMYVFNTKSNSWATIGTLPFQSVATTPMIRNGKSLYIVSGEIKPGIRTNKIYIGKIKS